MSMWQHIAAQISTRTGSSFEPRAPSPVGGGCINQALKLSDGCRHWFVKINKPEGIGMFEAEAEGLNALASTQTIRVPRALCTGVYENHSYIVIDYILHGRSRGDSQAQAGRELAAMHRHSAEQFGWHRQNTIGATHQPNDWADDWIDFWRLRRLGFQLHLAGRNGHGGQLQSSGEQLLSRFDALIDHAPQASLLHGDLWGGNITFDSEGHPVIFDPAVYHGDRETDLAMTELFGGFSSDFYAAYRESWPLDAGYRVRRQLYNLYHILNHLNLFGGGYRAQAQGLIDRLLAEC